MSSKKQQNPELYLEYARRLHNKKNGETVAEIFGDVFSYAPSYAKLKCWEFRKHPICQEEMRHLEEQADSEDPISKEQKLKNNKILMDEAFAERNYDAYIKLINVDNRMQGHEKSSEIENKKAETANALVGELISALRDKNKAELRQINEEIIELDEKKLDNETHSH